MGSRSDVLQLLDQPCGPWSRRSIVYPHVKKPFKNQLCTLVAELLFRFATAMSTGELRLLKVPRRLSMLESLKPLVDAV